MDGWMVGLVRECITDGLVSILMDQGMYSGGVNSADNTVINMRRRNELQNNEKKHTNSYKKALPRIIQNINPMDTYKLYRTEALNHSQHYINSLHKRTD